jgi:crotonobetainyl-CoA:carnitine CoA-transferase CaiB-like acyl-CoA transferase
MILADLGADVIKVERPGTGDDTRAWGPPFVAGDAAYFLALNRNKRSVVLDLTTGEGASAARGLAARSDVVVENFRPGLMETFGLGAGTLRATNERLVYCSLVAFDPEGEDASRPGYDIIVQALSGLMSFTGTREGEPTKVGVALLDVIAGLYAANAIQAALLRARSTGRGSHVVVSLFEASVAALVNQAANYLLGGIVPERMGNAHPNIVPYQAFHAADAPFILAAGNDRLFVRTCEAIGRPDLAVDPRFATNEDRVRNRTALVSELEAVFATRPASDWVVRLTAGSVPCAAIRDVGEVFASPEGARTLVAIDDPSRGSLRTVGEPIRIDGRRPPVRMAPPALGQHTQEVLAEIDEPTP